jgi:hypothetical protein
MHEHFDLMTNPFKYKCETSQILRHPFQKKLSECKMQLMSRRFNNIQNEWFNSCANVNGSRDAKKITNTFKYKCETLQIFRHPFQKIMVNAKCNSIVMDLTTFKVNDSTHVQMLMIQEKQKNSLTHSHINVKH